MIHLFTLSYISNRHKYMFFGSVFLQLYVQELAKHFEADLDLIILTYKKFQHF